MAGNLVTQIPQTHTYGKAVGSPRAIAVRTEKLRRVKSNMPRKTRTRGKIRSKKQTSSGTAGVVYGPNWNETHPPDGNAKRGPPGIGPLAVRRGNRDPKTGDSRPPGREAGRVAPPVTLPSVPVQQQSAAAAWTWQTSACTDIPHRHWMAERTKPMARHEMEMARITTCLTQKLGWSVRIIGTLYTSVKPGCSKKAQSGVESAGGEPPYPRPARIRRNTQGRECVESTILPMAANSPARGIAARGLKTGLRPHPARWKGFQASPAAAA